MRIHQERNAKSAYESRAIHNVDGALESILCAIVVIPKLLEGHQAAKEAE